MVNVINSLGALGPRGIQIALVLFSTNAQVIFRLNQFTTDKAPMIAQVQAVPYLAQQTDIAAAFRLIQSDVFVQANGDRPEAPNVIIIITDGRQVSLAQATLKA